MDYKMKTMKHHIAEAVLKFNFRKRQHLYPNKQIYDGSLSWRLSTATSI